MPNSAYNQYVHMLISLISGYAEFDIIVDCASYHTYASYELC